MKKNLKQGLLCVLPALIVMTVFSQDQALAHSKAELNEQAKLCRASFWNYETYVHCGYGRGTVSLSNLYAQDLDTDTHCAYTIKKSKATGKYVEIKSCGSTTRGYHAYSDQTGKMASCITGHWFCFWGHSN